MNLGRNYLRNDPAGFQKWVETLVLPEDKLKRIREMK